MMTVRAATGEIEANPALPYGVKPAWLEYHAPYSTLLGIVSTPGWASQPRQLVPTLVAIDTRTGWIRVIRAYPGLSKVTQGVSALDEAGERAFFLADNRLVTVHARSGAILAQPVVRAPLACLGYDAPTATLAAITVLNGATTLVRVDPRDGTLRPIASYPAIPGTVQGVSTLEAGQLTFLAGGRLVTVTVATGKVVENLPFGGTLALLEGGPRRS